MARAVIREALAALGIRRFLLAVHDASLPGDPSDDIGHGAPLSNGGRAFLRFAAEQGFDGLQLGPQGETTPYNPSPYDGTLFTRNVTSISLARMVEDGLLDRKLLDDAVAHRPPGALLRAGHAYAHAVMSKVPDAQAVAADQHRRFREEAHALGLSLIGDMQVGMGPRDAETFKDILLEGLKLGAPPSRTNPEGQPWGYAVVHPAHAVAFVQKRAAWLLAQYDGLRVDHPHGLIDPWVYTSDVQQGSRLFSSRDVFPQFAIAREDQLDKAQARYADGWVRALDGAQVERYAVQFDALAKMTSNLIVEILSTQPYPVRRVLERHGLGQFRVTQKADPLDANDVYRSENARHQDWITVGTHDTEPLARVVERWGPAHAEYLSRRLHTKVHDLKTAALADLFVGPAQNVMLFFPDLLGLREIYNRPGTIRPDNWTLRVPPDYAQRPPVLPAALALALRARGHPDLAAALEKL